MGMENVVRKGKGEKEKRRERGEGMRVYSLTPRLSLSRIYLSSE